MTDDYDVVMIIQDDFNAETKDEDIMHNKGQWLGIIFNNKGQWLGIITDKT